MNVVAILRSDDAGKVLNAAGAEVGGAEISVHVGKLTDVRDDVDIFKGSDLLILDVDPRDEEEVRHLRQILQTYFPNTPVVATAPDASPREVREFMQLGVADFVPQPFTRPDLESALDRAARLRRVMDRPAARGGRIISFLKAGGGAGASTLAVQSACLLATREKPARQRVSLLDLDVQFGTGALYLDLNNRVGLANILETPERLDGELLRSVMGHHSSGLDLLAAPRDMMMLDTLTPETMERCLNLVRGEYGTVFLDLPGAWTPWSSVAVRNSDLVILVIQLTVAGVRQARRQLDAIQAHGIDEVPVKIALNRYERWRARSVATRDAEKALGRKFDYFIVNDYKTVSEALNQGVALSTIKKKSKVEASIQKMIDDAIETVAGRGTFPEPRVPPLGSRAMRESNQ